MKKSLVGCWVACASFVLGGAQRAAVVESARSIPVAADVDVLVAGGTAAGVAAACAAADAGASVYLLGGFPYLGEDLAGTLELHCRTAAEGGTALERCLRAEAHDYAPYAYDFAHGFRYVGGWQFHNDPRDKLSTATFPVNSGDCVYFTNTAAVVCTLEGERRVAVLEVLVFENADPKRPAFNSVDHRGTLAREDKRPGPLTGRVAATFLDGPRQGDEIELARQGEAGAFGDAAVRAGEPGAVQSGASGVDTAGIGGGKKAILYRAAVDAPVHKMQIDVAPAEGAACHFLSRIHFRLAAADRLDRDPSPLKVKKTFDAVLAEKGVRFLTGSPATDLLVDETGAVAGVVAANRSGRQAFRAKCVVDATRYGALGRLGKPVPGVGGTAMFSRIVVSPARPRCAGLKDVAVEALPGGRYVDHHAARSQYGDFAQMAVTGRIWRCTFPLALADGSYASFAEAEWRARALTWEPSSFDAADVLRLVSPFGRAPARKGLLAVADDKPLGERLAAGAAAGKSAAAFAKARAAFGRVAVEAAETAQEPDGAIGEALGGLRPYDRFRADLGVVASPKRELPVLGVYDVVVVGGGTAGVPAALGAARSGAKTLLVEYLHVLGGVGTDGMILGYYDGNHCGFTQEFKKRVRMCDAELQYYKRVETWRRTCDEAGVKVWLGAFGAGVWKKDGKVRGVVVATPQGRGVVCAKCVIDGTGNADVAAAAGAEIAWLGAGEFALQSAGQAPQRLGRGGVNSDFGYVNDADAWDLWLFGVRARAGAPDPWDLQQLADSRERRRIVPDLRVEGWDVVYKRKFPDTINRAKSRQDSHGYLQDVYCYVAETDGEAARFANLPLRCYLPKGLTALATIGLGKGVARDVVPITRMQADLMNEGYAVGLCAAEAARTADGDFRAIDVKKIQRMLVEKGNLPPDVLDWRDDPECTDAELARAVAQVGNGYRGSGWVLRYPARCLPFLREGWKTAQTPGAKQAYATLLGLLGDASGAETLTGLVSGRLPFNRLRQGVSYGGESYERIGHAVALGRTKAPCALPALLALLAKTDPARASMRDVRAATLGLEALGDARAAEALAQALAAPGVGGWARKDVKALAPLGGYGLGPEMDRCVRELAFARALFACGDWKGMARKTLEAYARDPRGTLAAHANAVLAASDVAR